METKKDILNKLENEKTASAKLRLEQEQLNKKIADLQKNNLSLQAENLHLQVNNNINNVSDTLPHNPAFNFNLNEVSLLSSQYQNYINKLNVRESQFGGSDSSSNGFLVYLLILERARYFKNRILVKDCEFWYLEKLIYECFYYGALSGKAGLYFEDGLPVLVDVSNLEYNKYGELVGADIQPINYNNSTVWEYEQEHLNKNKVKNLAIFRLNGEEFGLWVLAYFYLEKVCEYFEILDTQTNFLNKKFGIEINNGQAGLEQQIYRSLIARNSPVIMTKDLTKLKALELPEIDLNAIFELIINFVNWFDNHILGIRTKDIDPSDKAREIVANSGINGQQASKQEQNMNMFVHDFFNEINNITGLNIDWVDLNIDLNSSLIGESDTQKKITNGREDAENEQ